MKQTPTPAHVVLASTDPGPFLSMRDRSTPRAERHATGKALRQVVTRSQLGDWTPSDDRADPVALVEQSHRGREDWLVPVRTARMAASPYGFLRGTAVVMAADLIEHYEQYPEAFKFIRDVPTDWSDTRVIHGAVGEYASIARKDRHSDDWYVGAVTDAQARSLSLPLAFLDADKTYVAEIYRDGDQANYRSERRFDLKIEKRSVKSTDVLALKLAPGGGQAIRLTPQR